MAAWRQPLKNPELGYDGVHLPSVKSVGAPHCQRLARSAYPLNRRTGFFAPEVPCHVPERLGNYCSTGIAPPA